MTLEIVKIFISPVTAVIIGIVAYFYKRWHDDIYDHIDTLQNILYIYNLNQIMLNRFNESTANDSKISEAIQLIPAYKLSQFGPIDDVVRLSITTCNSVFVNYKFINTTVWDKNSLTAKELTYSIEIINICLKFIYTTKNNILLYYFAPYLLKRKAEDLSKNIQKLQKEITDM